MKTLILSLALALSANLAIAEILPTLEGKEEKSFVLNLNDWKTNRLTVSIFAENGVEIFSERLQNGEEIRKYSLKNLPSGTYRVDVEDNLKSIAYNIVVSDSRISVENHKVTFKPVVNVSDGKVDLGLLSLGNEVRISITDTNGLVLYREKVESVDTISKRFDIASLPTGQYFINVKVAGAHFTEAFSK